MGFPIQGDQQKKVKLSFVIIIFNHIIITFLCKEKDNFFAYAKMAFSNEH